MNNKKLIEELKEKIDFEMKEYFEAHNIKIETSKAHSQGLSKGFILGLSYASMLLATNKIFTYEEYEEIKKHSRKSLDNIMNIDINEENLKESKI